MTNTPSGRSRSVRGMPILIFAAVASGCAERPPAATPAAWRSTVSVDWSRSQQTVLAAPQPTDRLDRRPVRRTAHSAGSHALDGLASFYWQDQKTASGERFDKSALTAAHRTLPFNTRVRVTNRRNGRSVIVRINDRGPFKPGRVIDLSHAAAGVIDMHKQGLTEVSIEVLGPS